MKIKGYNIKTDVIILGAGDIANKIQFINFSVSTPALIPLNVKTSSSYIIDLYTGVDEIENIYLIVDNKHVQSVKNELRYYKKLIIIGIANSTSVLETLFYVLKVEKLNENVIINIATTIPTKVINNDTILVDEVFRKNIEWSGIKIINNVKKFIYKNVEEIVCNAFTGVFRTDLSSIKLAMDKIKIKNKTDLLYLIEELCSMQKNKLAFDYDVWIDCGHENNYYDAKSKLVTSRSFNSIKINEVEGSIEKSSTNIDKFINEINYVFLLPEEIKVLFPMIYAKPIEDNSRVSATMEYYGYPTLAEYMLYWDLRDFIWEKIFDVIFYVMNKFKKYKYSIGRNAYNQFFLKKHFERLNLFQLQFKDNIKLYNMLFESNTICINHKEYINIQYLNDEITKRLENIYCESDFCIMHGDLCFNNILYDFRSNIIRLIDARGSFGQDCKGIYGDHKYDLAKITHSAIGRYDFIVNNLFFLEIDDTNASFNYEIIDRSNYNNILKLNLELIKKCNYKEKDILFLVGLLFVSMCPLHNDDVERQIVMYLHGVKYINENLKGE